MALRDWAAAGSDGALDAVPHADPGPKKEKRL